MSTARFEWVISRVRRIFEFWDRGLEECDKAYCLRRIRDKEPKLFYKIAREPW
jgi:hypothetical protein